MPRRSKTQSMFDDSFVGPDAQPDPPAMEDLAADERAILEGRDPGYGDDEETQSEAPAPIPETVAVPKAPPAAGNSARGVVPAATKKRKRTEEQEGTLVERVRARASRGIFKRIKFYEELIDRSDTPPILKMRAAEKLDELAIGKAPTAPALDKGRPKILIGGVAASTNSGAGFMRSLGDVRPGMAMKMEERDTSNEVTHNA